MIQTSPTSKQDSSGRRSRQLATPAEYHTLLETQKKSAIATRGFSSLANSLYVLSQLA
ncbi:hypothetical protein [Fischerella thermalis]|uniref:hypothetical protein n=1 Tax=Fischerella TaxID=1190 RepID=UPI000B00F4C9